MEKISIIEHTKKDLSNCLLVVAFPTPSAPPFVFMPLKQLIEMSKVPKQIDFIEPAKISKKEV